MQDITASLPDWVRVGEGTCIHPSVQFVPHENKQVSIGKRVTIASGAVIYGGTNIGNDSGIGHNTVVRSNTNIGVHSVVAQLCVLEGNLHVGDHTLIHSNNHICQKTIIGNYVFIAPLCVTTNDPEMKYYRSGYSPTGTHWSSLHGPIIKDACRIGVGSIIFPKISIGRHAVVGAGSIITKDIPDYAIVFGQPASLKCIQRIGEDQLIECKKDHT